MVNNKKNKDKPKIHVDLFFANWCSHCKAYTEQWNELLDKFKNFNNIKINKYEDSAIKEKNINTTINGNKIRGYPTVKISIHKNNTKNETEYTGKRNIIELGTYIETLLS
jgi:thiol-disulfide isomerase/thioredoxin